MFSRDNPPPRPGKAPPRSNMAALMGAVDAVWRDPAKGQSSDKPYNYLSGHAFEENDMPLSGHYVDTSMPPSPPKRLFGGAPEVSAEALEAARVQKSDLIREMRSGNPNNRMVWEELAEINKTLKLPATHTGT